VVAVVALFVWAPVASADVVLTKTEWEMLDIHTVQFHLQYHNPSPTTAGTVHGEVYSQRFGAFVPREGLIHEFDIPPIEPESFFDVFFEVDVSQLPPSAERLREELAGLAPTASSPCPPDTFWAGNVDVNWFGPGGVGQANAHYGTVFVRPGGGASFLHVIVDCAVPPGATWNLVNPCPATWTVNFLASNMQGLPNGPAPNPIPASPPPWDGWLAFSASNGVAVGDTCCANLNLTCGNVPATIRVCAEACEWPPVEVAPTTWGRIKALYR
jgi:hypothetical protein